MSSLHYRQLASYYDLIYAAKDYASEAADQTRLINKYKKSRGKDLLEVACGTGRYLEHFEKEFNCTGLDLNPAMLRIAKKRVGGSRLVAGDMLTFDLGVQFDVVACLFSSIGYIHGSRNLKRAIDNFSRHLKPGGVLLISPWVRRESFACGVPHLQVYQGPDLKIARAVVTKLKSRNISLMRFHWMIVEKNRRVRHIRNDVHELAMHSREDFLAAMKGAGLRGRLVRTKARPPGSSLLYVGVRPL